jgi:hypothetical protein
MNALAYALLLAALIVAPLAAADDGEPTDPPSVWPCEPYTVTWDPPYVHPDVECITHP